MLPAYYTRESDDGVDYRVDSAREAAAAIITRRALGLGGGMVIANPIPFEASMDRSVIDAAIDTALGAADDLGITGKETTPFLLGRIVELTGTASLDANVALVLDNARVASQIATAIGQY